MPTGGNAEDFLIAALAARGQLLEGVPSIAKLQV